MHFCFSLCNFFLEERFIVGLGKPNGPGGEGKSKRGQESVTDRALFRNRSSLCNLTWIWPSLCYNLTQLQNDQVVTSNIMSVTLQRQGEINYRSLSWGHLCVTFRILKQRQITVQTQGPERCALHPALHRSRWWPPQGPLCFWNLRRRTPRQSVLFHTRPSWTQEEDHPLPSAKTGADQIPLW